MANETGSVIPKLVNDPKDAVQESLEGFAITNPNVALMKDFKVIIRRDVKEFKASGKAAVVTGGGSGHEPSFAGHVGRGGLTAAIAGSVFASPPPKTILAALKAVENPVGILLFIINYTGDRMNFGLAIERSTAILKGSGPIRVVLINEDTALSSKDRSAGRRGLAGSTFLIKVAGALAEAGSPVEEIGETCEKLLTQLGTIGLSLSSCSQPGSGYLFDLPSGHMELGLGVHGEPGVVRLKAAPATEAVDRMLTHMFASSVKEFEFTKGTEVAVLINNLGSTTNIEMNIVAREVVRWLDAKGIIVKRLYTGLFMTSLEMHGISISIMQIDHHTLELLDAPCEASLFDGARYTKGFVAHITDPYLDLIHADSLQPAKRGETKSAQLSKENKDMLLSCLQIACDDIKAAEPHLNHLDGVAGDGDCGTTMKQGAAVILEEVARMDDHTLQTPSLFLARLSEAFEIVGGTTGAVYSILFSAASRAFEHDCSRKSWISALRLGYDAITRYGNARPGDRTLVDVLFAVLKVAEADDGRSNADFLNDIGDAAIRASEATKTMKASAGRASYVSEDRLDQPDAGAAAATIWILSAIGKIFEQT